MPGIDVLLDALTANGIPFCVATSGTPERVQLALDIVGLLPRFDGYVFTAAEVSRGKPAPDLFLHAAKQMGVDPATAAVVEDSELGVRAGLAAGMTVYAYGPNGSNGATELANGGSVRSLLELIPVLTGEQV
jgi:HAD superfamily hydrolase (TIGR01509 family)